jgi:hypothetical protein
VTGGVLFGVAAHALLLLQIRFNLAPEGPSAAVAVLALAPLLANGLYNQLRSA